MSPDPNLGIVWSAWGQADVVQTLLNAVQHLCVVLRSLCTGVHVHRLCHRGPVVAVVRAELRPPAAQIGQRHLLGLEAVAA